MATWYLFATDKPSEEMLSLCLKEDGTLLAPVLPRSIEDLKVAHADANRVLVVPAHWCSFHELTLPLLSESKARAAIPFALEDDLAEPLGNLHFAFDKEHHQQGRYLVVVLNKEKIRTLVARFEEASFPLYSMTADWFALKDDELLLTHSTLLVNTDSFKGALWPLLAKTFIDQADKPLKGFRFNDAMPLPEALSLTETEESEPLFLAQRIQKSKAIDFFQGEFKQKAGANAVLSFYKYAGILAWVFLVLVFGFNIAKILKLNQQLRATDQQIEVLYKQFFPEAKQVISPKFRISQLFKSSTSGGGALFTTLNGLAKAYELHPVTIEELRFQNKVLTVMVLLKDFKALEVFEHELQQSNIHVTQKQAALKGKQVIATLELSE